MLLKLLLVAFKFLKFVLVDALTVFIVFKHFFNLFDVSLLVFIFFSRHFWNLDGCIWFLLRLKLVARHC